MNKLALYFISILLFLFGVIFFCYQESWIIINIPQNTNLRALQKSPIEEIPVKLWAFKNNQWITETKQIIKNNTNQTLQNLINSWFSFLEEEQVVNQRILANSVIISPNNTTAFISLNQSPFNNQSSTYEMLMLIEGMLKTIKENKIAIQSVQLLIQHKPINDHRLNLSIPWNINGYIN